MKITIVSSSTRKDRKSHRVALALKTGIENSGNEAAILDLAELDLPPFYERLSHMDDPDPRWVEAQDQLLASDGLIFVSPEYNGAISSGLKTFIDVYAKRPFMGKPIGVATASDGAKGGIRAAYQLQQTILSIYGFPIPHMLLAGYMDQVMDEEGNIVDEKFQGQMDKFIQAYLDFTAMISGK